MVMINILMAAGITMAVKKGFAPGNYMMYSLICLPCFIIMIIGMSGIEFDGLKRSRVLVLLQFHRLRLFPGSAFFQQHLQVLLKQAWHYR